jgi:hypothetical protein
VKCEGPLAVIFPAGVGFTFVACLACGISDDDGYDRCPVDCDGYAGGEGRPDSAGRVEPGCAKAILIQLLVIVAILIVIIVDIKIIAMVFWLIQIIP